MEENTEIKINDEVGIIRISDEVIATIAGIAASEVKGVYSMSQNLASGIAEILGRKNFGKGVRVENKDNLTNVDLFIIVEYGVRIPEVAWQIQEKVKKQLESFAGLNIGKINVHVENIALPKQTSELEEPTDEMVE